MPLVQSTHQPPFWLPNGHFQSIYPSVFRKINVAYRRERIATPDGDFLNLDWSLAAQPLPGSSLVILSHGLEGDSSRQYITGMVQHLNAHGYHCLAWNFRSCGGPPNVLPRFYHSGETTDLDWVVQNAVARGYRNIALMGFSLGGNVTLKYAGERGANICPAIKKVVVFSVPMDLLACSRNIEKPENWLYLQRFLKTLKPKVEEKAGRYPDKIDAQKYAQVRTFYDFDDIYTGPVHGFAGADDYYHRSSSMHFVKHIMVPTLIVNAKNDPLVPYRSLPIDTIAAMPNVWLDLPVAGGHCGFRPAKVQNQAYWSEQRAVAFLKNEKT
ncbi:MAG: alpha/beta fold hydrolase [Runella slithyformis]|nr:MAG: alpha/beta fold hydrolase [Runella slithyformis]TAF80586.1 MAG: alpha/beta fold hydrolase [Runella slithyformis]